MMTTITTSDSSTYHLLCGKCNQPVMLAGDKVVHIGGVSDCCKPMQWTKEPPTVAGWYWWRQDKDSDAIPAAVVPSYAQPPTIWVKLFGASQTRKVGAIGGEWQGPIAPQEGDKT